LITDLEMPELSGMELIPIAKQRNAWTQIVVLTAHSTSSRVCEAMSVGAIDYLLKPVDRNQLEKVIQEAIERIDRWQAVLRKALRSAAATSP
jgi:two-component system response regulator YesN